MFATCIATVGVAKEQPLPNVGIAQAGNQPKNHTNLAKKSAALLRHQLYYKPAPFRMPGMAVDGELAGRSRAIRATHQSWQTTADNRPHTRTQIVHHQRE